MTCGNGTQQRERSCAEPAPQYGGLDCTGPTAESRPCFHQHCPIHCQWLAWSNWSGCSKSCDSGTTSRHRDLIPEQHGGDECLGDTMEVDLCNTQACPGEGA